MSASGFTRPVRVDSIPREGLEQRIEANEGERADLAKLAGLPAIATLRARFDLRPIGRGRIEARGEVHAEATQTCVVSLEPFGVTLDLPVLVRFAPSKTETPRRGASSPPEAAAPETGEEDPPDPIVDGRIDLGALATEFMILGLDPYPRKPGVDFSPPASSGETGSPKPKDPSA